MPPGSLSVPNCPVVVRSSPGTSFFSADHRNPAIWSLGIPRAAPLIACMVSCRPNFSPITSKAAKMAARVVASPIVCPFARPSLYSWPKDCIAMPAKGMASLSSLAPVTRSGNCWAMLFIAPSKLRSMKVPDSPMASSLPRAQFPPSRMVLLALSRPMVSARNSP